MRFERDNRYSRADVKAAAGLARSAKGGDWDTGVVEHDGEFLIFTNVGTKGRTGHAYGNRWEGAELRWFHKRGSHLGWKSVERLLADDAIRHVFWRSDNADPFTYAGLALALEVVDTSPVEFLWGFADTTATVLVRSPEEARGAVFLEGARRQAAINIYERDARARAFCIRHYGSQCAVCDIRFDLVYGAVGLGFIHLHHLVPLASVGEGYVGDPIHDLRPVCPNCHAMLHRTLPPLTIDQLRSRVREAMATIR
jgi:5-methylcytosine-specific restriction enzyme A